MATEAPAGALSPEILTSVMTVHHQNPHHPPPSPHLHHQQNHSHHHHHHQQQQNHHHHHHHRTNLQLAALSGINLSNNRMSGIDTHPHHNHRLIDTSLNIERLTNGLDHGRNLNRHDRSSNDSSSTTMPPRSRFMITDILAGAASPSSLQGHEPPGSPPSTPRDLSVRQQSRSSLNNSTIDEDSDTSHHDTVSVSSNGNYFLPYSNKKLVHLLA